MTRRLDMIYKEMIKLHEEVQERQIMLQALMAEALQTVREENTAIVTWRRENNVQRAEPEPARQPVHHVANADPAKMQVLTNPPSDK